MSVIQPDEDPQLRAVEERLASSFANRVSPQQVHGSVQRAYASLAGARIRTYVPVLVAKIAADELRAFGA
jgi:hypothetical protein